MHNHFLISIFISEQLDKTEINSNIENDNNHN